MGMASSVTPELFDHPIGRNDLVAVDEKQGEERLRPPARHLEKTTFMVEHLDRPEDQEIQAPLRDSGVQAT